MGTGATGRHGEATIPGLPLGWRACCTTNTVDVNTVTSSSYQRRFWRSIIAISNAEITPIAIWWRFTVTVTTRYMEAVAIVRNGMVLMTKADLLEEPCARKPACTVLQTSGGSDPFAEFNQDHRAVKRLTRPTLGFKSFWSARCTIAGIETMHAIRKGQLRTAETEAHTPAEQFYALAA